jgi:FkbH-like protein
MILREEHLAVFQANWSDKASNIRAIANMLSLGLESIVFLDDNSAERMQVRLELPDVAVPELPKDPALFARTLVAAGYFEMICFSEEDRERASFYQNNAMRAQILNQSSDINAYLKSLEMEISFAPFNATGRTRIVQLIRKSNQFNLTTKRYSEIEVRELEGNRDYYTRQIRLKDILGDNGMISVIVGRRSALTWTIDLWLMSCRVLGRQVELAVLRDLVVNAKASGARKLIGIYIPTARNSIVKDHYLSLGFDRLGEESGVETWELDIASYEIPEIPMRIIDVI